MTTTTTITCDQCGQPIGHTPAVHLNGRFTIRKAGKLRKIRINADICSPACWTAFWERQREDDKRRTPPCP